MAALARCPGCRVIRSRNSAAATAFVDSRCLGHYARGEQGPESDLDILVEFQPGRTPDLLAMVAMEMELNHLTDRRVDFRTPEEISRYVRERVLAEAKPIIVC